MVLGKRGIEAFTLVAVMVAFAILVAAVTSAVIFFGSIGRAAALTESVAGGTQLAQAKIEDLLQQTYESMAGGSDSVDSFSRTWTVSDTGSRVDISVTVLWQDIGGNSHTVQLHTARAP
jgi:type II secretory pathway pseudopilin PulG